MLLEEKKEMDLDTTEENLDTEAEGFEFEEGDEELQMVTMVDEESGESFDFYIACDFDFEDDLYYVLVSLDEEEPVALFARKIELDDGGIGFETVNEEDFPRVEAEYQRLCELMDEDFEDEDDSVFHLGGSEHKHEHGSCGCCSCHDHEHDHEHDHKHE